MVLYYLGRVRIRTGSTNSYHPVEYPRVHIRFMYKEKSYKTSKEELDMERNHTNNLCRCILVQVIHNTN